MGGKEKQLSFQENLDKMIPLILLLVSVPASMLLWAGNVMITFISPNHYVIPPTRWLSAILIPLGFTAWGIKRKSLNRSGAALGLVVGFFLTLSSYTFLACLVAFFVTSSKATKFRSKQKAKLEDDFKEGGERNWLQVLCNGGMATLLAILHLIEFGPAEKPIDFIHNYRASCLNIAVLAAFSCANGDTWASELGTVLSKSDPWLITTGRRVPKGVNGGVSLEGLVLSLLGGAAVGVFHYVTLIYICDRSAVEGSPPQYPIIVVAGLAGLIGSLIDSVLGATLQYSGVDKKRGVVVEYPGKGVEHISGIRILDNHNVNILSTILTSLLTPGLANLIWP